MFVDSNLIQERYYRNNKNGNGMILFESIINRTTWIDINLRSIGKQCFHVKRHYCFYTNQTYNNKKFSGCKFPCRS